MESTCNHQTQSNEMQPASLTDSVRVDLANRQGHALYLQIPRSTFDQLSLHIGNAYKTRQWLIAHYHDVDNLSVSAIERYLNLMTSMRIQSEQRLTVRLIA